MFDPRMQEQHISDIAPRHSASPLDAPPPSETANGARRIYEALWNASPCTESRTLARQFLQAQLEYAQAAPCAMPPDPAALETWLKQEALETGEQYAHYVDSRRAGGPRIHFSSRASAIWYLQRIAPTKLVDGAWLYGALPRWEDPRFRPLIRTYLEELGDGDPSQNHVLLYQQLLARFGGDDLPELSDELYLQGAVQLAFAWNAGEFLPELMGYNLGYERIPLHLLITTFELNELDIDPYYFTLHITIDNADSGHARKAVTAVMDAVPGIGDTEVFMRRVANGFRLSDTGPGTSDIVQSFDLERELVAMLERKRTFGKNMHSDFALIDGRTVNQWLEVPGQMDSLLRALEDRSWVKRHEDPVNSRFWQLVEGEGAQMYGVFSESERQLLHDWIAGDCLDDGSRENEDSPADRRSRPRVFRRARPSAARAPQAASDAAPGDPDQGIGELVREMESLTKEERMPQLIELMSPSLHTTATGLTATRLFRETFG